MMMQSGNYKPDNYGAKKRADGVLRRLRIVQFSKKKLLVILGLLVAAFLIWQFIANGKIAGITVVHKNKEFKGLSSGQDTSTKPSYACDKVGTNLVSDAMQSTVERFAGVYPDRNEPTLISTCLYRTLQKPARTITIVIKDSSDEGAAKSSFSGISKRDGAQEVKNLGDEATYSEKSRQMVIRKGKRTLSLSISAANEASKVANKDVLTKIASEVGSNF